MQYRVTRFTGENTHLILSCVWEDEKVSSCHETRGQLTWAIQSRERVKKEREADSVISRAGLKAVAKQFSFLTLLYVY